MKERLYPLKELLGEVRDDLKDQASSKDYEDLERRTESLEEKYDKLIPLIIKIGISAGVIGVIFVYIIKSFFNEVSKCQPLSVLLQVPELNR